MKTSSKTSEVANVTERAKPELVIVGGREIVSSGRWNDEILADYLVKHGSGDRWLSIGDLARAAWGQNTLTTKQRARRRLPGLFKFMAVDRGQLVSIEYGPPHNRALRVKMYNFTSEYERNLMNERVDRLARVGELSAEKYARLLALMVGKTPDPEETNQDVA